MYRTGHAHVDFYKLIKRKEDIHLQSLRRKKAQAQER